jgi:Ca2+-binding RTX toxin-like protein
MYQVAPFERDSDSSDNNTTSGASYASIGPALAAAPAGEAEISFAGQGGGFVVDLAADTYMRAIKVMPFGDSLTSGWVDSDNPQADQAAGDGYRLDLFEKTLAAGGWFDYVGASTNGPGGMLDTDHMGVPGKPLADMVDDSDGASDFSNALATYTPDVVLFMAGTNDFNNNGDAYFRSTYFPTIMSDIAAAVDQFYAYAENADKYLVISTLPPKARGGVPPEHASFLNEGYSIVAGAMVAGDAHNGTYRPGIKALVAGLQAQHATLVLFENPITEMSDVSIDLVHFTDVGYQKYAAALHATLEAEIGLSSGGIGEVLEVSPAVTGATGGEGGDRLAGDSGANMLRGGGGADFLEGRGGADSLEGGSGSDVFAYGADALDGTTDLITGYSAAEGDAISLGAILDGFGWTDAQIAANVRVTNVAGGAQVSITTPAATHVVAVVQGVAAADVTVTTTQFTQVFSEPAEFVGSARDDTLYDVEYARPIFGLAGRDTIFAAGGDDILTGGPGKDTLYGGAGADVFRYAASDLDARDNIKDFSISGGDRIDISAIGTSLGWSAADLESHLIVRENQSGNLILSLITPSGTHAFAYVEGVDRNAFLAADSVIFEAGPPPDTGDDDGNLALSAPDLLIEAGEATSVRIRLLGLDADATAVVTLSAGGVELTRSANADGELIFNLTSLPDGPIVSSVTATDGDGNSSTVSGPTLTLAAQPDTSADADGNLAVSAPDMSISASEVASVAFVVSGIDADATGVVTVSDGTASVVSAPIAADGTVMLNLSGLADGSLAVSVRATDDDGNTATVQGASITLDTTSTPPPPGSLVGTEADDELKDGGGSTSIFGFGGNDRLFGNGGDDIIYGGAGDDFLRGDAGNDRLVGGSGADTLRGQDGADDFVFTLESLDGSTDRIDGFSAAGGDSIDLREIVSGFGWTAAEAGSHLSFVGHSKGVYLEFAAPEIEQRLADLRSIGLADVSMNDVVLV